ncbi:MAG TPA: universal stress protein [Nitrospira sp.]|nr:universal stress protein [Nitrospira sp.]
MKILLTVDGSDHSYEAVRSLKYLARAEELHVVHVLDVPSPAYPMMMPEVAQELYETVERNMRDDGTRLLDRTVSLLPLDAGPVTKHVVVGSPAEQIVALAEQLKVGLILLGTRGLGPVKERLIGSVSHRVLTFAPGTKLILPGPVKRLQQVLLPIQGTYDADQAVSFLLQKPFRESPTVTLFTVLPHTRPPWPVDAVSAEHMETHSLRRAKDFLDETAAKLRPSGYQTRVATTLGDPVGEILREAQAGTTDLILIGSRGRRGITRMVLGSVSHALLHQGAYPLMIFS